MEQSISYYRISQSQRKPSNFTFKDEFLKSFIALPVLGATITKRGKVPRKIRYFTLKSDFKMILKTYEEEPFFLKTLKI